MTVKRRERKRKMAQVEALLAQGYTLQQAARAAGVDPATLWRWRQKLPPQEQERLTPRPRPKAPRPAKVPYRMDCPHCGGELTCKTAWRREFTFALLQRFGYYPRLRFWACTRCAFASWRPLAHGQCPTCKGYLVWTRSRLRKVCPRCNRVKGRLSISMQRLHF